MPPRSRAAAGPPPNISPIIVGVGFIGMIAAFYFEFPGVAVLLLSLMFAGWAAVPPLFNGKKDAQGRPTPADDGEKRSMNVYRVWGDLKWRLLIPNADWMPGMLASRPRKSIEYIYPPNLVWFIAVALGVLGLAIPAHGPVELLESAGTSEILFRAVNAFSIFSIIVCVSVARRRNLTPDDPHPGVTLGNALSYMGTPKALPLFFAGGIISGIAAMAVFVYGGQSDLASIIAPLPVPLAAVAVFVLMYATVLYAGSKTDALAHWRLVAAKRPEWEQRWAPVLKSTDESPRLVDYEEVGFFEIATFDASASMGYAGVLGIESKVSAAIGAGRQVTILSSNDIDSQGQPMPATINPRRFRVVTYPSDEIVDFTDPDTEPRLIEIGAEVAMMRVIVANGLGRPVFMDAAPAFTIPDPEEPEVEEESDADDASDDPTPKRKWWQRGPKTEHVEEAQPNFTAAWLCHWAVPNGPPFSFLADYAEDIGGEAGCDVVIDKRTGDIFFGALTEKTTPWTNPKDAERVKNILLDNVWYRRWKNVFQGKIEFIPRREAALYSEMTVNDLPIFRQPFSMGQGVELKQYDRLEDKLAVALDSAPMVAITGFKQQGDREGARHPQGMCVVWSPSAQMPSSPERLRPGSRALANEWVLTWILNRAFDHTKRLARPEIVSVKALTDKTSDGHIWEMKLRLYGGVTLAEVRAMADKIRQSMGCQWLRVIEDAYGCTIAAGVNPNGKGVKLANPRTADRIAELNWEQAFAISGVSGSGGVLPKLTHRSAMEKNPKVAILDFALPAGCEIEDVKRAQGKLSPATDNAFIQISPTEDPKIIRVLASERNPLEKSYAPDWDEIENSTGIPFATGVDGSPIVFDPKDTAHLMLLGLSGSGKANRLEAPVPVPVSERFPNGWARFGDLVVGDEVFTSRGTVTRVSKLHQTNRHMMYDIHLSDGQVTRASGEHLWRVSSAASRQAHGKTATDRRDSEASRQRAARVDYLRGLAAQIEHGTGAHADEIAELAGIDPTNFYSYVPRDIGTDVVMPWNREERVFDSARIAELYRPSMTICGHKVRQSEIDDLASYGRVSVSTAASILVGSKATRDQRSLVAERVRLHKVESAGMGQATRIRRLYPVDEALTLIADAIESRGANPEITPLETVLSTEEMAKAVRDPRGTKGVRDALNWAIRVPNAIPGEDHDLTVGAYSLGAWLGDGSSKGGEITSMDDEIVENVVADGYVLRRTARKGGNRAAAHFFDGLFDDLRAVLQPSTTLKTARSLDKRIPARYLRASVETRLAVLQGLMDTDGTVSTAGSCELSLSKHDLALDALELIRSLGIKASVHERTPKYLHNGEVKTGQKHYRIKFTTTLPVFRLARKRARLPEITRRTQDWLYVTDIVEVGYEESRCISVEDEEKLYLVDGFVPTHNSVTVQGILFGALMRQWEVVVMNPIKGAGDYMFAEPFLAGSCLELDDFFAPAAMMKLLYEEVSRRMRLIGKYGVTKVDDLPEEERPKRVMVILDEFTSVIEMEAVPKVSDEAELEAERDMIIARNTAKRYIAQYTGKILREARAAGFTLMLATQKLTAKSLDPVPGGADMKSQLSRLLLGNASFGDKMSALRQPEKSPDLGSVVPAGRGIYEPSTGTGMILQSWYAPVSEYERRLIESVKPITVKLDYEKYVVRPDDKNPEDEIEIPDAFDAFGSFDEFPSPDDDEDEGPAMEFTIAEPVEFSLDDIVEPVSLDTPFEDEPAAPEHTDADGFEAFDAEEFVPDEPTDFAEPGDPEPDDENLPVVVEEGGDATSVIPEPDSTPVGDHETVMFVDIDGCLAPMRPGDHLADIDVPDQGIKHIDRAAASEMNALPVHHLWLTDWDHLTATRVFAPIVGRAWDAAPSARGEEYWWKIESIVRFLDDHPQTQQVIWIDDLLDEDDANGSTHRQVITDLMDIFGVRFLGVSPNGDVGMTAREWDEIRGFLGMESVTDPEPVVVQEAQTEPETDPTMMESEPEPTDDFDYEDFAKIETQPAPVEVDPDDPFGDAPAPRVVEGRIGNTGQVEGADAS